MKDEFSLLVAFLVFFLACRSHKLGLLVIIYVRHGQCFICGFLLLTFIKSESLATIYSN